MGMNPIGFSGRTFSFNKAVIKQRIIEAKMASPEYKAEIRRIFQKANRRIQNDIKGFTKFSMKHSWEDLKAEYAKAVGFLRQPTSTATGVREYNKHLMDAYDLTEDEFNLMADKIQEKFLSVSDENFVEQYLMRYKDFTGELETEAADVSDQIETDAARLEQAIEQDLEKDAQNVLDYANSIKSGIMSTLKKFGL